ncbi:hypothetical protein AS593_06570 [Caulobacter vibrioides]|nr:hypothetical protein AS593_06570 [Caulobacter vibrioides]
MTKIDRLGPEPTEGLTAYDQAHLKTYLRLLDAAAAGADWREAAKVVLGLDAYDPDAHDIHARHLARAEWMTEQGYRHLLVQGAGQP